MSHHPVSQMQLSCMVGHSLRKHPTFRDTTTGFPAKWGLRNEHRNSILMTCHYPEQGSASVWSCHKGDSLQTNQKHYPDLGSDASSEWNFCSRSSDIILRGNQWWCHKMPVFSGRVHYNINKAVLYGKLKGAQYSETVKSRVPSIWFVWKIWDFLVARRQKLGARGHRALLEHIPDKHANSSQGLPKFPINKVQWEKLQWYWCSSYSLALLIATSSRWPSQEDKMKNNDQNVLTCIKKSLSLVSPFPSIKKWPKYNWEVIW